MKSGFHGGTLRHLLRTLGLLWLAAVAGLVASTAFASPPGDNGGQDLGNAIAAKERHASALLSTSGVVGAAVGLADDGRPAVLVFTRDASVRGIPGNLDGVPVVVHVSGDFRADGSPPEAAKVQAAQINRKGRFSSPVPIGVSTGNANECAAGTIGARVLLGGNTYALSNNHVYARENAASLGEEVLQPGRYDTNCAYDSNNHLGNLSNFVPISFGGTNTVDAAIAAVPGSVATGRTLWNSTPADGYGTPRSATTAAFVGQKVQKYGRTTGQTNGQVVAIEWTGTIGYSAGSATFDHQIIVLGSSKPFIRAGDSGSLMVTRGLQGTTPDKTSVGLLFASSSNGYAIANRIGDVLAALGITIDGAP